MGATPYIVLKESSPSVLASKSFPVSRFECCVMSTDHIQIEASSGRFSCVKAYPSHSFV